MRTLLSKALASLLAFTLLLTILHIGSPVAQAASSGTETPDGIYPVTFRYVKDNTTATSAANSFVLSSTGRLVIEQGKSYFEHEVTKTNHGTFAYFGARKAGAGKAVIVNTNGTEQAQGIEGYENVTVLASQDTNNVVYRFMIEDIWARQDVLMHIDDTNNIFQLPVRYNHWYNAQLEIHTDTIVFPDPSVDPGNDNEAIAVTEQLFQERITVGYSVYSSTIEGYTEGLYPIGSKQSLHSKLVLGQSLVDGSPGNASLLKAAYLIIDEAIKGHEASRIVINRLLLQQWINTASAWVIDRTDGGMAESGDGAPADPRRTAITPGEYPADTSVRPISGPVTQAKAAIINAQALADDPLATQTQINDMTGSLIGKFDWTNLEKQRFAATSADILVLDSIGDNAQLSPHASDFVASAVLVQQTADPYYAGYANITFSDPDNKLLADDIRSTDPDPVTGSFSQNASTHAPTFTSTKRPLVTKDAQASYKTYQIPVRSGNTSAHLLQTDERWSGFAVIRYPESAPSNDRKTVFISFNGSQLRQLNELIADARIIYAEADTYDSALEDVRLHQYPASFKQQLLEAIDEAALVGSQLSASRPAIFSAIDELQEALDQFDASRARSVYFSAAHATKDEFSTMEDYFVRPALLVTDENGNQFIHVTINNSHAVPEFRVRHNGAWTDAVTLAENINEKTKLVSFPIDDLSALIDAQVRTVVPEQNYDRTHSIRLNINNVDNNSLYKLIGSAAAAQRAAVEGTEPGQYAAFVKTVFQNAIDAAQTEATRTSSTAADSHTAFLMLNQAFETFKQSYVPGVTPPVEGENGGPGGGNGLTPVYPANGYYYINFDILKYGTDNRSIMASYVVSTALLHINGSSRTVSFTVKQSNEITGLALDGSSGNVVSRDTSNNTRVVSFPMPELSDKVDGWVKVDWPQFDYFHEYDVQFRFKESTIRAAGTSPSVPGGGGQVGPPAGYGPEETESDDKELDEAADEQDEETANQQATDHSPTIPQFNDIADNWAKTSIERAIRLGIVNGYADGSFRPNALVTREEFTVMISRALQLEGEAPDTVFSDFDSIPVWAQSHVARSAAAGIIGGFADGTFRSKEPLSRAQLAVIIARAADLKLGDETTTAFADDAAIPTWAKREIAAAARAGFIQGKEKNLFDPLTIATRAEALTLIIRMLDSLV